MDSHSPAVKRSRRAAPRPPDAAAESLPTKQSRSKETMTKLLDAAEAVLAEGGLEQATVPAIAARAGLSVGVVYRRFPDKDALLRAVYERYFERARATGAHAGDPQWWEGISLPDTARTVVNSIVAQHRHHRQLLRALTTYTQTADAEFRKRVDDLNAHSLRNVASLLLQRRAQIHHPDPERAVSFGLFMVAASMRAVTQASESSLRPFGIAEADLGDELTRMFLTYLGVRGRPTFNPLLHRR